MPFWIWLVFIGIVISAVMSIRAAKQERNMETAWAEEEGQKYLERMRLEQEKRGLKESKEYTK